MRVRAKMQVSSIEHYGYGGKKVNLHCVHGTSGENADFAAATPAGNASLTIDKSRPAADAFIPGQEYYVDFTPVGEAQ